MKLSWGRGRGGCLVKVGAGWAIRSSVVIALLKGQPVAGSMSLRVSFLYLARLDLLLFRPFLF